MFLKSCVYLCCRSSQLFNGECIMKKKLFALIPLFSLALVLVLATGCSEDATNPVAQTDPNTSFTELSKGNIPPAVAQAHRQCVRFLDDYNEVVGVGIGKTDDKKDCIIVFSTDPPRTSARGHVPVKMDNVPVRIVYMAQPMSLYDLETAPNVGTQNQNEGFGKKPGSIGTTGKPVPTYRYPRPVPIGVSVGNQYDYCGAGTISCRVSDAENTYILSCNHVLARSNNANIGELITQPGGYDNNCTYNPADVIGSLTSFYPLLFSYYGTNEMDAGIAQVSTSDVGTATPSDGYGQPNSTTYFPAVDDLLQKYGRTTGLTKRGKVFAVNTIIVLTYGGLPARFVNQIIVKTNKAFAEPGDSGSLAVTQDDNCYPVGIIFGKSQDYTYICPIDPILNYFGVTIDGK